MQAQSLAALPSVAVLGSVAPALLILVKLKPTAPSVALFIAGLASRPLLQSCCAILAPLLVQLALLPDNGSPPKVMPVSFRRPEPWPTQPAYAQGVAR